MEALATDSNRASACARIMARLAAISGLLGRAFADTMLEISGKNSRVLPPKFNGFAPPNVGK